MNIDKIRDYYKQTEFEYHVGWNWKTKHVPALHFGYYDETATTHKTALLRANSALAEWAGIKEFSRIVDAGCGVGNSAVWLAEAYNAIVSGVTIAPNQADAAKKMIDAKGVKGVDFFVANYLEMPFADNTFDVVWAFESACYATDKSAFYKEAFRVLKPGGKLVMAEYIRCARPLSADREKLLKDVFGGWMVDDLDTLEEHKAHSLQAGFTDFRHRDVTKNVIRSYKNLYQQGRRFHRFLWLLNKTGLLSDVRYNNARYSMQQLECIQKNVFFYSHVMAVKPL